MKKWMQKDNNVDNDNCYAGDNDDGDIDDNYDKYIFDSNYIYL